jgi:hypothetical protein
MPKSTAPIDLLRKYRGYFAKEAEQYREIARTAPSIEAKRIANELVDTNNKFISEIDATLRDWG